MSVNTYLHTSIVYSQWKGWDGIPLDQPPLFYNGLTESAANFLSSVSDEVLNIAKSLELMTRADMSRVRVLNLYKNSHILIFVSSFVVDIRGTNKQQRSRSTVWRGGEAMLFLFLLKNWLS